MEVHHIVPEADGGSSQEDNGICLCFDCHAEAGNYNDRHPRGRKLSGSELRRHRDEWFKVVTSGQISIKASSDKGGDADLLRFYSQCFDRPAFQDRFVQERSVEAFDKALEDTITAINTGCLKDRDGCVLFSAKGKSFLVSDDYRAKMDEVVRLLRSMRNKYIQKLKVGEIWQGDAHHGSRMYCINNPELAKWFDDKRGEILGIVNSLLEDEGIFKLTFPVED